MSVTISKPVRRRPVFHPLPVAAVDRLTDDAIAITFAVPPELRETFEFRAGQHLTVRRTDTGEDVRRSYSICSTPVELESTGALRIGVKEIPGGAFSSYAATALRTGDAVEVMPPLGHFTSAFAADRQRHYAAIAAGSGITPVLSLIATALAVEPAAGSRWSTGTGTRAASCSPRSWPTSRTATRRGCTWCTCSPASRASPTCCPVGSTPSGSRGCSTRSSRRPLWTNGSSVGRTAWSSTPAGARRRGACRTRPCTPSCSTSTRCRSRRAGRRTDPAGDGADVTILLEGRASTVRMGRDERVLDAALRVRSELPYSCKGGVCSTCRARIVEGEVRMARNFALEPDELAAGYVLTCQSSPVTDTLVVDYDA